MIYDPRLANGGLGELARLIGGLLPNEESVQATAQRLSLPPGRITGRSSNDRWQSLLTLADDSGRGGLDNLLDDVEQELGDGLSSDRVAAWRARGARSASVRKSLGDVRQLMSDVFSHLDPREADRLIEALAYALNDLVRALRSPAALDVDYRDVAHRLLPLTERAYDTARGLVLDLRLADTELSAISNSASVAARFEAKSAVVGQMSSKVSILDREVHRLLVEAGVDPLGRG